MEPPYRNGRAKYGTQGLLTLSFLQVNQIIVCHHLVLEVFNFLLFLPSKVEFRKYYLQFFRGCKYLIFILISRLCCNAFLLFSLRFPAKNLDFRISLDRVLLLGLKPLRHVAQMRKLVGKLIEKRRKFAVFVGDHTWILIGEV